MTTSALDRNIQALKLAIERVGGVTALARALGIRQNRVSNWLKRGVPPGWITRVSRATGGSVTSHEFDPIAFPDVLGGTDLPHPSAARAA